MLMNWKYLNPALHHLESATGQGNSSFNSLPSVSPNGAISQYPSFWKQSRVVVGFLPVSLTPLGFCSSVPSLNWPNDNWIPKSIFANVAFSVLLRPESSSSSTLRDTLPLQLLLSFRPQEAALPYWSKRKAVGATVWGQLLGWQRLSTLGGECLGPSSDLCPIGWRGNESLLPSLVEKSPSGQCHSRALWVFSLFALKPRGVSDQKTRRDPLRFA